jgi:hypothetical protein
MLSFERAVVRFHHGAAAGVGVCWAWEKVAVRRRVANRALSMA